MQDEDLNPSDHTVLAVDDDPDCLRILETYLNLEGYNVLTAVDGKEAWEMVKVHGKYISVIMLDRQMPVMNGLDFLKLLHGHSDHFEIPVIMQTAVADTERIKECMQFGVYHYLRKPFDEMRMIHLLKDAISGKRNIREMRKKNVLYKKGQTPWDITQKSY